MMSGYDFSQQGVTDQYTAGTTSQCVSDIGKHNGLLKASWAGPDILVFPKISIQVHLVRSNEHSRLYF